MFSMVHKGVMCLGCLIKPFLQLAIRLWMAAIFWKAGLTKVTKNGEWPTSLAELSSNMEFVVYQFTEEFQFFLPKVWAYSAAAFEIIFPIFLVIGLMTRIVSLPFIGMALTIQFYIGWYLGLDAYFVDAHYVGMMLLGSLIAYGPGMISMDYLLCRFWCKKKACGGKSCRMCG